MARRHGLHSSLLFRWRRAVLAEQHARTPSAPPTFVPLALPPPAVAAAERPAGSGVVEIELAGGHRPRAEAGADLTLLQDVIAALLHRWAGGYEIMMHGPEGAVWQAAVNDVALITIALSIVTVVDLTLAAFRLTPLQGNHASWRLAIRHCGKSAIGALSAQLFESAQRNLLAQKAFLIGQAQEPS